MFIGIEGKITILCFVSYAFPQNCEEVSYPSEFKIEVGCKQFSQKYEQKLIERRQKIERRGIDEKYVKVRSKSSKSRKIKMVHSRKNC